MLAASPEIYIGGLSAYREGGVSEWCELFAEETARAASEAERLAEEIESLEAEWLARAGEPREGSAARLLIAALPEQPVLDSATAQRMTGRSHVAVNNALRQLDRGRHPAPPQRAQVGPRVGVRRAARPSRRLRAVNRHGRGP